MSTKKGFAPVLILILALIIAGASAVVFMKTTFFDKYNPFHKTPSQATSSVEATLSSDIKDWKTYLSEKGGFSFQYPPNWHVIGFLDQKEEKALSAKADLIYFYSPRNQLGDYMCMDIYLNNTSENPDPLEDDITNLPNGFEIFQNKQNHLSPSGYVHPRLIVGEKFKRQFTGNSFLAVAGFNCDEHDDEGNQISSKLTFDQQIKSEEYRQILEIYKSFKFTE